MFIIHQYIQYTDCLLNINTSHRSGVKFTDTLFTLKRFQSLEVLGSGVLKAQLSMVAHTSTQGTEAEESSQLSCQSGLQSNTLYEEEKKKPYNVHQMSSSTVIASSYQVRNLKSTFSLLSQNSSSAAPTIPSCWSQPYNFRLTQTGHPPLAAPTQIAKCSRGKCSLCQSTLTLPPSHPTPRAHSALDTELCRPGLPE